MLSFVIMLVLTVLSFWFTLWEVYVSLVFMAFLVVLVGILGGSLMYNFVVLDNMSYMLVLLSIWVTIMMLLAMFNSGISGLGMFNLLCMFMLLFLVFCFTSVSLLGFYVFFEMVLIPIVLMIFYWGGQPERLKAGVYMMFYTLFGSLPLLLALIIFSWGKSMSYLYVGYNLDLHQDILMVLSLLGAFLVKMPMYGVHLWLPKAHVEAPVAGSMILAGVLLKLGVYGIYRVMGYMWFSDLLKCDYLLISISLVGGSLVSLFCLRQVDVKMLIANSSVVHMSVLLVGVLSGCMWGAWGALLMMIAHGLCSSALFCLANFMYERFYTRNLFLLSGLMLYFPSLALWWFMFSVINMGAPPFMNLFGEIILIGASIKWSLFSAGLILIISFLSAAYSLYFYSFSQHGKSLYLYSVDMIYIREYVLMILHFIPLVLFLCKIELFMFWA